MKGSMTVWIPSFAAASKVRAAWSSSPSMTGAWPEGGDAGRREGGGELVGALDERVRLDLRVADLGHAGDGALQVRGDSVADRVELDGGGGHGRSFQEGDWWPDGRRTLLPSRLDG
jgi:hypothetical protein